MKAVLAVNKDSNVLHVTFERKQENPFKVLREIYKDLGEMIDSDIVVNFTPIVPKGSYEYILYHSDGERITIDEGCKYEEVVEFIKPRSNKYPTLKVLLEKYAAK